jgi:hypothetical protein
MGSEIARVHAIPVAIGRFEGLAAPCWTHVRTAGVAASAAKRANARLTAQEVPVNTRTIAIVALIIAVIVLIVLLM